LQNGWIDAHESSPSIGTSARKGLAEFTLQVGNDKILGSEANIDKLLLDTSVGAKIGRVVDAYPVRGHHLGFCGSVGAPREDEVV
jgi:hypothetical protein